MSEMVDGGEPLFPGTNIEDELQLIIEVLGSLFAESHALQLNPNNAGTPTEESWSDLVRLPEYKVRRYFSPPFTVSNSNRRARSLPSFQARVLSRS